MSTQAAFPSTSTPTPISSAVLPESDIPALLAKLRAQLPHSLPLYRRLQFHLLHPNPTSARAFLSLADGGASDTRNWLQGNRRGSSTAWLAAYIDLSHVGQTQAWVYASWEPSLSSRLPAASETPLPTPARETQVSLLHSLFATLLHSPAFIPAQPASPPVAHQVLQQTGKYSTPYSPSKVLFGTLHQGIAALIPQTAVARKDAGYLKYIFEGEGGAKGLLPGYRFGAMEEPWLQIVLDRTAIPRTMETLRTLGSVGVFWEGEGGEEEEEETGSTAAARGLGEKDDFVDDVSRRLVRMQQGPVAWGFLGKDASLTSLHTESRHRGKGLAVAVARKLMVMQGECFGVEGGEEVTRWAHADVSESNMASRSVMEKVGGKVGWTVAWVEVDCARLDLGLDNRRIE